jgi:hypothetical protein
MIFLNGNTDVVTKILEFVAESSEELNTCATISRVFRLARENPRLDQTRSGTIIFKTPPTNIPPEVWQRWDQQVFTGNRVRLVAIIIEEQYPYGAISSRPPRKYPFALTNVREVILQRDSSVKITERSSGCDYDGFMAVTFFKKILPSLDILDIGALAVNATANGTLALNTPNLGALDDSRASVFRCTAEVVHTGCHFSLKQPNPFPINNNMKNLREIHIDAFGVRIDYRSTPIAAYCQEYNQLEQEEWFAAASYNNSGSDWVLLQEYPNLERVTLKHAAYFTPKSPGWKSLPQEALMKFVRHAPKLCWFCSDLTPENIAILKEKRPDVEFCN